MTAPALTVPTTAVARPRLPVYFIAAFAVTWPCWGVVALAARQGIPLPVAEEVLMLLGGLGPLLAALGFTARQAGVAGVRALLEQLLRWRVHPGWYAVALLGSVALVLTQIGLVVVLTGAALPPLPPPSRWLAVPIAFLMTVLLRGGLYEEIGWRGYALPRLQRRWGALPASLLLGLIWASWHLPQWFIPGQGQDSQPFALFAANVVALSVILAWLYNSTGGSLLITALAHTANNVTFTLFGPTVAALEASAPLASAVIGGALTAVLVLLIVLLTDWRTLTRRRDDTPLPSST